MESCLCSEMPLLCKETSWLLGCVLLEPSSGRQCLPKGSSVPRVENVVFPSVEGKGWHVGVVVMLQLGCVFVPLFLLCHMEPLCAAVSAPDGRRSRFLSLW